MLCQTLSVLSLRANISHVLLIDSVEKIRDFILFSIHRLKEQLNSSYQYNVRRTSILKAG